MSEPLLQALIGLVGSLSAALIGAFVTLHIHNRQVPLAGPPADPPPGEAGGARRRVNLAIPFTAISLILAALFGAFLAQTLRATPGAPTPSATPAVPTVPASPTPLPVAATPSLAATSAPTVPTAATPAPPAVTPTVTPAPPSPPPSPTISPAPAGVDTATAPPAEAATATLAAASPTPAAPAATPTLAPGVYGLGARAVLTPGVYLVISQMQVVRGSLTWQGTLHNDSSAPFNFQLNRPDLHFQDAAGQPLGGSQAQGSWPTAPVAAHASASLTFAGSYSALPAGLASVDLVVDSIAGQGPFTFRRMLTLGTPAAATPVPIPPGQQVALGPGATLVVRQMQVQNGSLIWTGTFHNGGATAFNFRLAREDAHFADSTGQAAGNGVAQGNWPDGDVAPGTSAEINFASSYRALAAGVQYIDLALDSVSGYGPFVFRRLLSSGPGAAATPAVYLQGARAVLTSGVYLVITQMQVQNGEAIWQGTLHNETNSPFNFRLARDAVRFQDGTGQPLPNATVQGTWPDGDVPAQGTAQVTFHTNLGTPPAGLALDLVVDTISGYGPFVFRRPSP